MQAQQPANAATQVFHIPELVELILLSLPHSTTHQELFSQRTILLCQTISRTWHLLINTSTPLRQFLYLPTTSALSSIIQHATWNTKHAFPPCRPNSWIPTLLLQQRSWGSAWPFELSSLQHDLQPSQPRLWTFSLEISQRQSRHLAALNINTKPWKSSLASSPPFTDFWSTRTFYELGSGRAPFMHYLDYDASLPKWRQESYRHCTGGVTLGHLVDAVTEMFALDPGNGTKFVLLESVRVPEREEDGGRSTRWSDDDRPRERDYMPGMSAGEQAGGW